MNPIYRITVKHDPSQPEFLRFTGQVFRVSDGAYMEGSARCAAVAGEAVDQCRQFIARLSEKVEDLDVYTDESGYPIKADLSLVREYAPDTDEYPTVAS